MFKIKLKYKLVETDKYNDLILMQELVMSQNAELKKVCQCRECRHGEMPKPNAEWSLCVNNESDNYGEVMNPYGSCEKCERR